MCTVCGCGEPEDPGEVAQGQDHAHHHHDDIHHYGQGPAHAHAPGLSQSRMVQIEQDILARNNAYANANRRWFTEHGILALNLVSSPGSGKTTLLTRTIDDLKGQLFLAVIEGDQQTMNDANRIRETGAPVVQVNTGKGCHLDSHMIHHAIEKLKPESGSIVMIENVGNLVCPSLFDLGEGNRVVIISVTEGDDKPIKYPNMFESSQLCIINKTDLLPYVPFDVEKAMEYARQVNPKLEFIQLSAYTGEGMDKWYEWLAVRQNTVSV